MRTFSSYGPVDTDQHFYVPRRALVTEALNALIGRPPEQGGGYITVWAPRQRGKSWLLGQVRQRLLDEDRYRDFDVVWLSVEDFRGETDPLVVVRDLAAEIARHLGLRPVQVDSPRDFATCFASERLAKPLVLIIDEFDALGDEAIDRIVSVFRRIHGARRLRTATPRGEQDYLLHGVALIGVRSVLGVDSASGSPFNVQRSLHVPNLTLAEVRSMFAWYQRESGQAVAKAAVDRLFQETEGQPGLVSWFGELLTETYNRNAATITTEDFDRVYAHAVHALPNVNIQNLIVKVAREPWRNLVLELFQTKEKQPFGFDEPLVNHLYMHGVVDQEITDDNEHYIRFACPFVQKRLFLYFSRTHFRFTGEVFAEFEDVSDTVTDAGLDVKRLLRRYERHLRENRDWLLKDAPRRQDLRIHEAVYHFILYSFVDRFLRPKGGRVYPEFPTGNGKIDLLIRYAGNIYGLELKAFTDAFGYRAALRQAARYGKQLGLREVVLACFVESTDDDSRRRYETVYEDSATRVTVTPVFVATA